MGKLTTTEIIFIGENWNEQYIEQISTPPPVTTKMKIKTQLDVICLFFIIWERTLKYLARPRVIKDVKNKISNGLKLLLEL